MCRSAIEVDRIMPIDYSEVLVRLVLNLCKNKFRFPDVVYLYPKEGVPTSLQRHYQKIKLFFYWGPLKGC